MNLKDFRVAWRLLAKEPGYSLVAVLGLAVGLAAFLLLLAFARYSWSYDAHVPDAGHVYVVKHRNNLIADARWEDKSPLLLREAARATPGVMDATGYVGWFPLTLQADSHLHRLKSLTALPGFVEMLGLHAVQGDLNEALTRPDTFAITESTARRLFGTTDVLGRAFLLNSVETKGVARIAAVLRDPPANTTIPFESLNGVNLNLIPAFMRDEMLQGAQGWPGSLLIRLHPEASPVAVAEALQQAVDRAALMLKLAPETVASLGGRKVADVQISPLREAYFDRDLFTDRHSLPVDRGDRRVVAGLVAIAVLILALAAINYVNLATLRVIRRQREIGMRKVLGIAKWRLAMQFLAESLLASLSATVIGLALAVLALPMFEALVNRGLSAVLSLENIAMALCAGGIVGVLVAIYPAWIAFGVRPAQVLAGRPDTESQPARRLRQALSVLQVAAAMGLASFTLAVAWQTRFAIDTSPGFDPAPLLVFEMNEGRSLGETDATRGLFAELGQHPAIAGVTAATDAVGRTKNPWRGEFQREGGASVALEVKEVTPNFFELYGISPVAGRLFDPRLDKYDKNVPLVVNEIAARQLGFATAQEAVGQVLLVRNGIGAERGMERIVGIAPEIRFRSLREAPGAVAYHLWSGGVTVTVRASGSVADAASAVRSVWPKYFPHSVLEMSPAKNIYAENYADDARLAKLLSLATIIAMFIAAIGTYVLATDAVQRRTREIALRKLFGAGRRDVGRLVAREIGTVILLAALIAIPLGALAIARYLAPFTERTPMAYWALALAVLVSLAVVTVAAVRQARIAMFMKPAVVLRS
ncbi:MAG TPA: FtsX-like permease family protein [Steroidobacteraceae bacterium]|nr:FtsX-like permease family protein [Steroidobacteraceae bacterium]